MGKSRRHRKAAYASVRARRHAGRLPEEMSLKGILSAASKTPEQRTEHARQAARARWAKHNAKKALERGELPIDDDIVI